MFWNWKVKAYCFNVEKEHKKTPKIHFFRAFGLGEVRFWQKQAGKFENLNQHTSDKNIAFHFCR